MPRPAVSWMTRLNGGPPLGRQRLVWLSGGGLLLVVLLVAQGALEQATTPMVPSATPTTGDGAVVPAYSDLIATTAAEPPWWVVMSGLALKLVIVLALIYGVLWVLRHFMARTPSADLPTSSMHILQTLPLGQQQALHLVEVADRVLVLGATPGQITLLTELTGTPSASVARPFDEHLAAAGLTMAAEEESAAPTSAAPASPPRRPASVDDVSLPASSTASPPARTGPARRSPVTGEAALRDGQQALARRVAALRRGNEEPGE